MSQESLTQPLPTADLARPVYADAEETVTALDAELELAFDQMKNGLDAGTEAQQAQIMLIQDAHEAACMEATEKGERAPSISSLLEGVDVPDEYRHGAQAYDEGNARVEVAEAALEAYAPQKAAAVRQQIINLTGSLDYDQIADVVFSGGDAAWAKSWELLHDVGHAIGVIDVLDGTTAGETFNQLKALEITVEAYRKKWSEQGLLRQEPGVHDTEDTNQALISGEQLNAIELAIQTARNIQLKYKGHEADARKSAGVVTGLLRMISPAGPAQTVDEVFSGSGVHYNAGLSAAINRKLAQKLNELPVDEFNLNVDSDKYKATVQQAREIVATAAVESMEISGSFESLPFEFDAIELKQFLVANIPAIALARVKRLTFRPLTSEEDREDNTLGFHRWSDELGGSEIVISDTKVQEDYNWVRSIMDKSDDPEASARFSAKNSMLGIVTHEYAHALHNALPVAALQGWEAARARDPTNVTQYVKDSYGTNHPNRYKEDFADSMELFVNKAYVLRAISPVRFTAMQQMFEEFMPDYATKLKKQQVHDAMLNTMVQRMNGTGDDELRALYLSHERQEETK